MNGPNLLSASRLVLAPLFFGLFEAHRAFSAAGAEAPAPGADSGAGWILAAAWLVFGLLELSDVLDGWWARRAGLVTPLGKLLDPLADVIGRLTTLYALTLAGFLPSWLILALFYRELGMTFLRLWLIQKGKVQGASSWGKAKAWAYFGLSLVGMAAYTWPGQPAQDGILLAASVLAAALAWISFGDYLWKNRSLLV